MKVSLYVRENFHSIWKKNVKLPNKIKPWKWPMIVESTGLENLGQFLYNT